MALDDANTTLVVGANGHGKSTFMDAICYVLYNKAFRKVNKPQLLNSINNKNCVVEIEFTTGKDRYLVRRGMKPGIFEILKNGDLINQEAANRDYQEILEKYILKMTFKSFCQVVILGSASFVPFMQLPTGQRREIIEDLLDIQIFTTMNMLLKDKANANARELLEVDYKQDLASEKIKMQEDHLRSMLTNSQELIEGFQEKIAKHEREIASERTIIDEKRREQSALINQTTDYDSLSRKLSEMSSIRSKLNDRAERIEHDIAFFHDHDNCPTCKQIIDEAFKAEVISGRQAEATSVAEGIAAIGAKLEESEKKVDQMKSILDRISTINLDINMKSSKIKHIESSIRDLNEQIEQATKKNQTYAGDNDALRKLGDELKAIALEKKRLIEVREIHRLVSQVLKDNGIKARIIKQYVPIINKLINKYLAAMDFFVQFELDENFNETIKSRFRDIYSYASFSEGEKTRIDLALLFAWRAIAKLRNSASTNLLILDEVFDGSLDAQGSDDFLGIIQSVSGEGNIFVISHKTDQMKDKFDKIVEFEKKNNFSRIV